MSEKTALIAMSGGVDSSVAAYLMQRSGYRCIGGTMQMCNANILGQPQDSSFSDNITDAECIAHRLGMDFYVFDSTAVFQKQVIDKFVRCYEEGSTPNPCVDCNRHLKFEYLLQRALDLGCDRIATGHYAQVRYDPHTERYLLYKAADKAKDQSYFLACLSQYQLAHIEFPLGALTKELVRAIAEEQGFLNAKKRDSQDICFIPDGDHEAFLRRYTGKEYPCGDFIDFQGNILGKHKGAVGYTIGQRKGLGLAAGVPVYVQSKDMAANTVTVGPNEALFHKVLRANDWNWFPFPQLDAPLTAKARIRYRHTEQPAVVFPEADGTARVEFAEPQRAITPGQSVVLYDGDQVIGGGTITEVL